MLNRLPDYNGRRVTLVFIVIMQCLFNRVDGAGLQLPHPCLGQNCMQVCAVMPACPCKVYGCPRQEMGGQWVLHVFPLQLCLLGTMLSGDTISAFFMAYYHQVLGKCSCVILVQITFRRHDMCHDKRVSWCTNAGTSLERNLGTFPKSAKYFIVIANLLSFVPNTIKF